MPVGLSLLCVLLIFVLASCSFYNKNFSQGSSAFDQMDDYVVQLDDFGEFWDPEVPERALEDIAASSARTNTIVLIYVHGWHHNAQVDDGNAVSFAKSVANTCRSAQ